MNAGSPISLLGLFHRALIRIRSVIKFFFANLTSQSGKERASRPKREKIESKSIISPSAIAVRIAGVFSGKYKSLLTFQSKNK